MAYEKFYRFYDLVMGDRSEAAGFVRHLIQFHHSRAQSVLELACGTGGILGYLTDLYDCTGVDRSTLMLSLAKTKLPHVRFHRQNIAALSLPQKYDAIVCVFDAMNHLGTMAQWRAVFRRVKHHLNPGVIFVFDINTKGKLRRLAQDQPWAKQFGRDTVIIKVIHRHRGHFDWRVTIFEHQRGTQYRRLDETIEEAAFPLRDIRTSLKRTFSNIKALDPTGNRASDSSERVYFVCA